MSEMKIGTRVNTEHGLATIVAMDGTHILVSHDKAGVGHNNDGQTLKYDCPYRDNRLWYYTIDDSLFHIFDASVKIEPLPYPKYDKYFKATVIRAIYKKDIRVRGTLPDVIPVGYETWFSASSTSRDMNLHPERNRWGANIPSDYFKVDWSLIHSPDTSTLAKFKEGDKVRLRKSSDYYESQGCFKDGCPKEGKVIEIRKSDYCYRIQFEDKYENNYREIDVEAWEETKEKAISYIPKKGDWVVITKGHTNWNDLMEKYVGKCVQVDRASGDNINFIGDGGWTWNYYQGHFRPAEAHEIPVTKKEVSSSKSLVGMYLQAMENYPEGGSVLEGEIGLIVKDDAGRLTVDFESQKNYYANVENIDAGKYKILFQRPFKEKSPTRYDPSRDYAITPPQIYGVIKEQSLLSFDGDDSSLIDRFIKDEPVVKTKIIE